jgi:hypothetical protein
MLPDRIDGQAMGVQRVRERVERGFDPRVVRADLAHASSTTAPRPACPPDGMGAYPYEYMTAAYLAYLNDPRAGQRYTGHHAQILREQDSLALVCLYPPGASQLPGVRPALTWIDLASSEQCDAGPGSLTTIGTGDAPKEGALFLISRLAYDEPSRFRPTSVPLDSQPNRPSPSRSARSRHEQRIQPSRTYQPQPAAQAAHHGS